MRWVEVLVSVTSLWAQSGMNNRSSGFLFISIISEGVLGVRYGMRKRTNSFFYADVFRLMKFRDREYTSSRSDEEDDTAVAPIHLSTALAHSSLYAHSLSQHKCCSCYLFSFVFAAVSRIDRRHQ